MKKMWTASLLDLLFLYLSVVYLLSTCLYFFFYVVISLDVVFSPKSIPPRAFDLMRKELREEKEEKDCYKRTAKAETK